MIIRISLGAALALSTSSLAIGVAGCGSRMDSGAVTETGNPSFIDRTRVTATPLDGVIRVEGDPRAVPKGAQVTVVNTRTEASSMVTATGDGSFSVTVDGRAGDEVELTVVSAGKSQQITVRVTTSDVTSGETSDSGDTSGGQESSTSGTSDPTSSPPVSSSSGDPTSAPPTTEAPTTRVPLQHRAGRETCDETRPPGDFESAPSPYPVEGDCESDADCTEGTRGRCLNWRDFATCTYDECSSDDECSEGGPCGCEDGFWSEANACLQGNCQVDSDCGNDGYCSPSLSTCGDYSGVVGYWCHTAEDTCVDDGDCVSPDMGPGYCMFSSEVSHWVCSYSHCVG